MFLQYLEYEEELQTVYRRVNEYGYGRCIEVHGIPGVGLNQFVKSFMRKFKEDLKNKKNIYCCEISCPKDYPENLFVRMIQKIVDVIFEVYRDKIFDDDKKMYLNQLNEYICIISSLDQRGKAFSSNIFAEYINNMLDICHNLCEDMNIRLFITGFDNARLLFEKGLDYALLFKEVCENSMQWLGIIITDHRTVAVIALVIEAFSEFASLFSPVALKGFNDLQMEQIYKKIGVTYGLYVDEGMRKRIWYYCGNNPQRLSLLFTAIGDLQASLKLKQWRSMSGEEILYQAYRLCSRQMEEQIERIMRNAKAVRGDGMRALEYAVNNPYSEDYNMARGPLFQMGILLSQNSAHGKMAVAAIPMMKEVLKEYMIRRKGTESGQTIRALHLSDMHFGSEEDDTNLELRKAYVHSFYDYIEKICQKKKIDYIFITGDIGWAAKEEDYNLAEQFVHKVLNICGLTAERLFICPGNHDIDQSSVEEIYYPENQEEADIYFKLEKLDKHAQFFEKYSLFCKNLGCPPYSLRGNQNYLTGIKFDENAVIICLNTAWFPKKDVKKKRENERKAWVGKNYVVTIRNEIYEKYISVQTGKKLPVITLMHHPVKMWAEEECSSYRGTVNSWELVSQMSDYILCGHTHEISDVKNVVNDAPILNGGAFYQSYDYDNSFYIYEFMEKKYKKAQYIYSGGKWTDYEEKSDCGR